MWKQGLGQALSKTNKDLTNSKRTNKHSCGQPLDRAENEIQSARRDGEKGLAGIPGNLLKVWADSNCERLTKCFSLRKKASGELGRLQREIERKERERKGKRKKKKKLESDGGHEKCRLAGTHLTWSTWHREGLPLSSQTTAKTCSQP